MSANPVTGSRLRHDAGRSRTSRSGTPTVCPSWTNGRGPGQVAALGLATPRHQLIRISSAHAADTVVVVGWFADCVGGADYRVAMPSAELPELVVADAAALRSWLLAHHATSPGVWLALAKKGGTLTTLTWQQAVDEALCVGWIDGQARKRDDETSLIRFTPRGSRSAWSERNVGNVARLEREGRMLPAGRAAVEAARADGRWQVAYAPQSEAEMPAELVAAIAANPAAQAMLEVLTKANRYSLIYRLGSVKQPETRERKISEFVAMLARHETIHPQTARPTNPPR
jgi:uncharacterized protein YdeI (YjbR/CyaY-like superfamily)